MSTCTNNVFYIYMFYALNIINGMINSLRIDNYVVSISSVATPVGIKKRDGLGVYIVRYLRFTSPKIPHRHKTGSKESILRHAASKRNILSFNTCTLKLKFRGESLQDYISFFGMWIHGVITRGYRKRRLHTTRYTQ